MSEKKYPNRWVIAIAGVIMQTCLGTVYAWSVFRGPLLGLENNNWTANQINNAFTLVIVALAFSAVVGGYILDSRGPRIIGTLSGIFFGIGLLVTGFGVQIGSLPVLFIGYCLICGIGLGFGYIVPVATLVKWFPDKRGLITGLAVLGFGMGSGVMAALVPQMLKTLTVEHTFYVFGAIFLVAVTAAAQLMVVPPPGYTPAGWTPPAGAPAIASGKTFGEAIRSKSWWILWAMLFINISAGMAVISQASPMTQTFMGAGILDKAALAGTIMLIYSVFNTIGRIIWASISDKIGRREVFFILFISQAIVFFLMWAIPSTQLVLFVILACWVYGCLGGGFATMPAYAADIFGTKYVGRIYGWMLTAWAAAGVLGPQLFGQIFAASQTVEADGTRTGGNYSHAMLVMAIIFVVAIILPALAPKKGKAG